MSTVQLMQNITIFMELSSFITGLIYWKKIKASIWVWFVIYLGFITGGELVCYYLGHYTVYKHEVNKILNYIIIPAEFIFLYWLYYKHAQSKRNKLLVIVSVIIYLISFVADQYFFHGKKFIFGSFSYSIGNLLLLLVILSFFIQFSKGDEILYYKSSFIFWISLGAIVFYLGTLPYFGLIHLLYNNHRLIFNYYTYLMFAFNWIMYLFFIIGFIRWKPR